VIRSEKSLISNFSGRCRRRTWRSAWRTGCRHPSRLCIPTPRGILQPFVPMCRSHSSTTSGSKASEKCRAWSCLDGGRTPSSASCSEKAVAILDAPRRLEPERARRDAAPAHLGFECKGLRRPPPGSTGRPHQRRGLRAQHQGKLPKRRPSLMVSRAWSESSGLIQRRLDPR